MKTLAILSISCMFAFATLQSSAQDLANLQNLNMGSKIEQKSERKDLRKLVGNAVNQTTINSFREDFGRSIDPTWKRSANFDEATFTKDGKTMTAFYDYDSKLLGTTSVITFADLPAKAQREIKAKYKHYSIGNVIVFDDNELNNTDMMLWNNQFDDADNYFVELIKGQNKRILRVDMDGFVYFFKKL